MVPQAAPLPPFSATCRPQSLFNDNILARETIIRSLFSYPDWPNPKDRSYYKLDTNYVEPSFPEGEDIQAAYQRLKGLKTEHENVNTKVETSRTKQECKDLGVRKVEEAATQFSRIWNLTCARKLQARFPREIRDLVYKHMLDAETIQKCYTYMIDKPPNVKTVEDHWGLPHFFKSSYMGRPIAREIVEMLYTLLPTVLQVRGTGSRDTYVFGSIVAERFISEDIWRIDVAPAELLKDFKILVNLEDVALDPEEGQLLTDLLLSIKNRKGFKLEIHLHQNKLRLNLWPQAFEVLKPILEEYERQDAAKILIIHRYENYPALWAIEDNLDRVETKLELNEMINRLGNNWMEDATKFSESHPEIEDRHRYYLVRTDADCESDRYPDFAAIRA
ncbi:hypothetical protein PtrSN002B_006386 [Pyrenophora tritici-repentis]|uniref:Uncharacterized protein n=1 Tax=Pyrenophora tritici-repentis TaxID=45151 RepID=A0A2W1FET5_9PLEO|nr:hypothetical protein PtrM4_071060 [Pyrenophora tritici-repentis]KAI0576227.1 hypothetical protein Alg215_07605 [Pyrenophora tritici-repentis]KAI0581357.1 hypothetical protein Alg130_06607 [Pyrenophora tritici-repentis]KAI0612922.1 hypothetical protein TUN205_02843 [Pyrenophora tritici-repentis]KAI0621393.1 hypothetical protein TUN199_06601 [Pyrenophora tritici-repentis]